MKRLIVGGVIAVLCSLCKPIITLPMLSTTPVTSVTETSGIGGGSVDYNGNGTVSAFGVCYSPANSNIQNQPTLSDKITVDGSGVKSFTSNLTGLAPSTIYYVRAYATNEAGTAYGSVVTFTTSCFGTAISSGTTNNLYGVYFTDANNGWAVGSWAAGNATILHTGNGGTNWVAQANPATNQLNGVYFTDANNGWAVGNDNILYTNNGGTTWVTQSSGTSNNLFGVYFTNASIGYAVGTNGTILTTTNGGTTWGTQSSNTANNLFSIYFTNTSTGYAVGTNGTILTTSNGGVSWTAQTSNTTNDLYSIYFTDANNGWAVGNNGTILYTNNGGSNWMAQTSNTTNFLRDVYFANTTVGYAVGGSGTMLTTNNGGNTWTVQIISNPYNNLHTAYDLHAVWGTSQHGYAVGNVGTILQF
ncbi:MAG: WD40/YVTN/BNR-like repeat-containing protein [Bacteroidia bacterium]